MELSLWVLCLAGIAVASASQCGPEFDGKCFCGEITYQDQVQYVVNCTDTAFANTSVLEHLPEQTQVGRKEAGRKCVGCGQNTEELCGLMRYKATRFVRSC